MKESMEYKILNKSANLFNHFGISRVKFGEIANSLGITTRTIYNYYPNKKALVQAVSRFTIDRIIKEIKSLPERDINFEAYMNSLLKMIYQELSNNLPAYNDSGDNSDAEFIDFENLDEEIQNIILELLSEGYEAGYFIKIEKPAIVAQVILNQVHYCFPTSAHRNIKDENTFIESIMTILFGIVTSQTKINKGL